MKFPSFNFQVSISRRRQERSALTAAMASDRPWAIGHRKSREGIALVITLILLSVTLIMAVAFLALSRRERNAVATTLDTTAARLAADAALAAAQAQIVANIFSTNSGAYDFRLLVSTNYINPNGFVPGVANPTNVNYDFIAGGGSYTANDLIQNIANLWFLPRVPVYVYDRNLGSNDFRYYLDLNRNGKFEDSGDRVPNVELDLVGNLFTNGFSPQIGDPQWIGLLEKPDQPHGPNNPFVARYAFFAQPIGNSLDLNYIHNQTLNPGLGIADGFFRNEGVGSWELNLAGFLTDLNTNQWNPPTVLNAVNNPYSYQRWSGFQNAGVAFEDARSLLAWRYAFSTLNLAVPSPTMNSAISGAGIDGYTVGNLMTTTVLPLPLGNNLNWAGSDNPNRFFSLPSDLFGKGLNLGNFPSHLAQAGSFNSTYDRYTYYRMLDQLGTDSSADDGKMNLNYQNIVNGAVVPGRETNCYAWTPDDFFTNAADRMLRYYTAQWFAENPTNYLLTYYNTNPITYVRGDGYGLTNIPFFGMTNQVPSFGLTNIPVYVNGRFYYSPAVNRILQLAANMYDATTNAHGINAHGNGYPSVFRPGFYKDNFSGDVFINGYQPVISSAQIRAPLKDFSYLSSGNDNFKNDVYGLPWIIGAKKGFPNFNQFYSRNIAQVTRKLEVWRTNPNKPGALGTNQLFEMGITNQMGCSFWNSYDTNYSGNLTVYVQDIGFMVLSNGANPGVPISASYFTNYTYTLNSWPRSGMTASSRARLEGLTPQAASFLTLNWNFDFIPDSIYQASTKSFFRGYPYPQPPWDTAQPPEVFPEFLLMTTNWIQAYILDNGHVVDYVQLRGPNGVRNLSAEIADSLQNPNPTIRETILNSTAMWDTNGVGTSLPPPTKGVGNQVYVSRKGPSAFTSPNSWKKPPNMPNLSLGSTTLEQAEAAFFDGFFELNNMYQVNGKTYQNTNLVVQAPYTPTRTVWDLTLWQANDPLVHYLASDLATITKDTGLQWSDDLVTKPMSAINLATLNVRFQPWGRAQQMAQVAGLQNVNVDTNAYNLSYRDPLVWDSDFWDFPTSKLPGVGWLGRVHRGTPWQTVYLKSSDVRLQTGAASGGGNQNVGTNTWAQWTGDTQTVNLQGQSRYYDAVNSSPVSDSGLFDLFTTRFNDNAARGALSVNQTHLASWSAVLSGVVALTNTTKTPFSSIPPTYQSMIIQPAGGQGLSSPVGQIANSINSTRTNFVNADGVVGAFEHVGDILRTPLLTVQSPFLNWNNTAQQQAGISDEVYEWLPQQIMGLLRVSSSPRYVVYCYGQALRPASGSQVLTGSYFQMITNYQVVAESAARAVIRLDKHVSANGTNYTSTVESYNPLPPD